MERRAWDALRTILPDTPEEIERWGSVIHWPDAHVSYVAAHERGRFAWIVSVTCGSCRLKRNVPIRGRQALRGKLSADDLRLPNRSYASFGYTGLCRSCHKRINKQNITYPDGTRLFHQERTKEGLSVFCGACKKRSFLRCALSETLHDKHWPCPNCGDTLGKWLHEQSGATVYWLKREEGQRNHVAFDCAKCGHPFFCKDELPERAEWWGMDEECRYKYHPQRVESPLGERVGQSPPKPGRHRPRLGSAVRIPCPFPGCKKINEFHIESTRRDGFLPLCKDKGMHTRNQIAAWVLKGGATQTQNNNVQKNESTEKQSRGGARNIKWTCERRATFLATYEDVLRKVQTADSSLPEDVRQQASLRGNKPSDVARDYAARLLCATSGDYLQRVLAQARKERASAV